MRYSRSNILDLEIDAIDHDWNFFDLGGHSLLGVELTLAIERVFGIEEMAS